MVTFEKAKELFVYDRETGIIKWRKRTSNRRRSNMVAGSTNCNGDGYTNIQFNGKRYYAHRIAMLLSFGFCDDGLEVDHINHVRNDNRLVNLRFVTHIVNGRNQSKSSNNTTGIMGAYYHKGARKYMASINVDGVQIHLGYFSTLEEAAEVRKAAELKYKFNANHGTNKIKDYAK